MSNKRTLLSTSPDSLQGTPSKRLLSKKMSVNNNSEQDVFSWSKLCEVLDVKLKDVARKDDITALHAEIEELKVENAKLKCDVKLLSDRLEMVDRKCRSTNIVVNGLCCTNPHAGKNRFVDVCKNMIGADMNISHTRMLSSGKTFIFTLDTYTDVHTVLSAKGKLMEQQIYVHKDYTPDELNTRYNLRRFAKSLAHKNEYKVRLGEFCVFINDKRYSWSNGNLLASSELDAKILSDILADCNSDYNVLHSNSKIKKTNNFTQ